MLDLLQVVGALGILIPYIWTLLGSLSPHTIGYLASNMLAAGLLAVLAFAGQDWGFLLLEGSWSLVAAFGLLRLMRTNTRTRQS